MSRRLRKERVDKPVTDAFAPTAISPRVYLIAIVVAIAAFATFLPALDNDFNYDDDEIILRNYNFRGFAPENVQWMFTTFHMGHYQPVTWLSLAADYSLWEMNPRGYHTTNVVLHALSAVFVFLIARRFFCEIVSAKSATTGIDLGASMASLLFAVHPLRVESVAWITERRDVLSSLLLLICLWMYLHAHRAAPERHRFWIIAAFVVYVLSLLSRAMGVTLPVILLLLDWYPLKRIGWGVSWSAPEPRRAILEKLAFFVVAMIFGLVALLAQQDVGAAIELVYLGGAERIAIACYGLVFYVYKTLWPIQLAPFYELKLPVDVMSAKYIFSALAVLAMAVVVLAMRKKSPGLLIVTIAYVVVLFPVLGLFQSGRQEVADRYSYLPGIILGIAAGGLVARAWIMNRRALAATMSLAALLMSGWWATLTWQQCKVWENKVTLWRHGTQAVPTSYIAQYNLGCAFGLVENHTDAIAAFRTCLDLNPAYYKALFNMGNSLQVLGRSADALDVYAKAIAANPKDALSYYEQGNVYLKAGRREEALASFKKVLEIRDDYPKANVNLGVVLAQSGKHQEAIEQFRKAIKLDPALRDAHYNLAISLEATGKADQALVEYRDAIRIDPNFPDARVNLGNILVRSGSYEEAAAQYRAALRLNPSHPAAKANLDRLLVARPELRQSSAKD